VDASGKYSKKRKRHSLNPSVSIVMEKGKWQPFCAILEKFGKVVYFERAKW
jgi:hypothetical protein